MERVMRWDAARETYPYASYHLKELGIALDRNNLKRILPPSLPRHHRVLDVGCGAGQTLIASYPEQHCYGIDIDYCALRLGKELTGAVSFVCAGADRIPFPDGYFDTVIARVSLPYTRISSALLEIHRVLRPGGLVWMTLHSFQMICTRINRAEWKDRLYCLYVLLNGALFHVTGREFQIFGYLESFQTRRGISRALRKTGFKEVTISTGDHFVVTAHA